MWYFSYLKDDSIKDYSIRYAIGFKNDNYHSEKDLEHINRFIVFINGRTQWIEMNEDIIEALDISDDTAIITWDHRGQGDSFGKRGYVSSYDEYIKDGLKVISKLIPKDKKYIIISHSMGGLISLSGIMKKAFTPTHIVLISPLLLIPGGKFVRWFARFLCFIKHFGGTFLVKKITDKKLEFNFETNKLTHSYKYFLKVKNTPYPVDALDIDWLSASLKEEKVIFNSENIKKLEDIPVLLIYASKEAIVDISGFNKWFLKFIKLSKYRLNIENQIFCIEGAYHELLTENDLYRNQTFSIINNWLNLVVWNKN